MVAFFSIGVTGSTMQMISTTCSNPYLTEGKFPLILAIITLSEICKAVRTGFFRFLIAMLAHVMLRFLPPWGLTGRRMTFFCGFTDAESGGELKIMKAKNFVRMFFKEFFNVVFHKC